MAWRARIAAFGSAAGLIVVGILCTALFNGTAGQILGIAAIGTGAVLATGFVFLEVGLSEDHERERERRALLKRMARPKPLQRPRLKQSRGHRHRLG
jgi:hypothetical protein